MKSKVYAKRVVQTACGFGKSKENYGKFRESKENFGKLRKCK